MQQFRLYFSSCVLLVFAGASALPLSIFQPIKDNTVARWSGGEPVLALTRYLSSVLDSFSFFFHKHDPCARIIPSASSLLPHSLIHRIDLRSRSLLSANFFNCSRTQQQGEKSLFPSSRITSRMPNSKFTRTSTRDVCETTFLQPYPAKGAIAEISGRGTR